MNNIILLLQKNKKKSLTLFKQIFHYESRLCDCWPTTGWGVVVVETPQHPAYQKIQHWRKLLGYVQFPAHWHRSSSFQVKVKSPVLHKLLDYDVCNTPRAVHSYRRARARLESTLRLRHAGSLLFHLTFDSVNADAVRENEVLVWNLTHQTGGFEERLRGDESSTSHQRNVIKRTRIQQWRTYFPKVPVGDVQFLQENGHVFPAIPHVWFVAFKKASEGPLSQAFSLLFQDGA